MTNTDFINLIAPVIVKYAKLYGYKYPSAIIAQACNESGYGRSSLGKTYHNYFGMKCGSKWSGKSVNLATKEEYKVGELTDIRDNFRVYDTLESGVEGYFNFISTTRYENLKTAISPKNYLELIKEDGYATSSDYVANVYAVVEKYNLFHYDGQITTGTQAVDTHKSKSIEELANECIKGLWGNGEDRINKLTECGYDAQAVQLCINTICSGERKTVEEVARECIRGLWGNGKARRDKLTKSGYNVKEVQECINRMYNSCM